MSLELCDFPPFTLHHKNDLVMLMARHTYYFDEDGKMLSGWYADDKNVYYLGDE